MQEENFGSFLSFTYNDFLPDSILPFCCAKFLFRENEESQIPCFTAFEGFPYYIKYFFIKILFVLDSI